MFILSELQDPLKVYQISFFLLGLGLIVAALQDINCWYVFKSNGILSWQVSKLGANWSVRNKRGKLLHFLLNDQIFKINIYLRLVGSILLCVLSLFNHVSPILIISLLFLNMLIVIRNGYGLDGAYQMHLVLLFGLGIGSIFGIGSIISKIGLGFIAAELVISYFISGIRKLFSPLWRREFALNAIFSTRSFGHPFLYRQFNEKRNLTISMSWFVMLFETFFFIIFFINPLYALIYLAFGLCFHLFNAIFMGLNDFLFAFGAAYPALIYCMLWIREF